MPAVTVDDITTLHRVADAGVSAVPRSVACIYAAPQGYEGEGFPVRRAFAGVDLALLDPFIHMDQMGEVEYAPGEPKGTPWHPHRGFETVTYILDGTFEHADSHGGGGRITNGDTQWMTAGGGVLHIEKPPEELVASGGLFHGVQLWVNLPRAQKWAAPRYQDLRSGDIKLATTMDAGVLLRVIAGDVDDIRGPGSTYTPMTMVHATLAPTAQLSLPWRRDFNALVYVLSGRGTVGPDHRLVETGELAVFGAGDTITVTADARQETRSPELDVVILGGHPIREPVAWGGPFVMNTRLEVIQAFEDFSAGRMGRSQRCTAFRRRSSSRPDVGGCRHGTNEPCRTSSARSTQERRARVSWCLTTTATKWPSTSSSTSRYALAPDGRSMTRSSSGSAP